MDKGRLHIRQFTGSHCKLLEKSLKFLISNHRKHFDVMHILFKIMNSILFKQVYKIKLYKTIQNLLDMDVSLWAVVNLNSNRTCPVCTGLSDNSLYWPCSVQYVALTRLTYDSGQFSWHNGLTMTTPMARSVPGLILGLFDRPHWISPPWYWNFPCLYGSINMFFIGKWWIFAKNSDVVDFGYFKLCWNQII